MGETGEGNGNGWLDKKHGRDEDLAKMVTRFHICAYQCSPRCLSRVSVQPLPSPVSRPATCVPGSHPSLQFCQYKCEHPDLYLQQHMQCCTNAHFCKKGAEMPNQFPSKIRHKYTNVPNSIVSCGSGLDHQSFLGETF